jgi:hypothetical protein
VEFGNSDFGFLSDFGIRISDVALWSALCALCQNDSQFLSKLRNRSSSQSLPRVRQGFAKGYDPHGRPVFIGLPRVPRVPRVLAGGGEGGGNNCRLAVADCGIGAGWRSMSNAVTPQFQSLRLSVSAVKNSALRTCSVFDVPVPFAYFACFAVLLPACAPARQTEVTKSEPLPRKNPKSTKEVCSFVFLTFLCGQSSSRLGFGPAFDVRGRSFPRGRPALLIRISGF